ncbi:aminoacyl-tRNA hydrolase [Carboxylicivirga linearis]|uniref:Peptidyl-tRNA hydrolase n=1 Tax=Carboxylicivirga linearis TaxID=1628157 RepID=A0ABS5JRU3_9BACT|nr:aminoacyl-tRNA hydrolase [Carboxylicivirga linearis]MBS2097121.1 aminoacyl-tRNA hydrolase [Carboxylicivirga linearis]
MKYLIVGLGNIGDEYAQTRHNIGFDVLDELAREYDLQFKDERYGAVCTYKFKSRQFILLKPNTYVNLSGKAVNYWLQKEKIPLKNLLVIVDDLALPFGSLRLKTKGGDAGHNGLKSIQSILGGTNYSRLRFGIGNEFQKGQQVDFVLGRWSDDENETLKDRKKLAIDIIKAFGTIGASQTMNQFNNK